MSILFWDAVGSPFDGDTPKTTGLGGSEMAQIQLAEALASRGYDVKVLVGRDENKEPRTINKVTYGHSDLSNVKTVIASRMSVVPEPLGKDRRVIVSLTDMGPHQIAQNDLLVGVSRWQLSRFPNRFSGQPTKCIPPIVESTPIQPGLKVPGRFVYASARMKGLDATLRAWANIRPILPANAHLQVTTAGWDLPLEGSVKAAGAEWLGVLTPSEIRTKIASAMGLFYVNTYPETFCAIAAIAEASRTRPIIYCPPLDGMQDPYTGKDWTGPVPGALPEVLNTPLCKTQQDFVAMTKAVLDETAQHFSPKNYSKNKITTAWENVL